MAPLGSLQSNIILSHGKGHSFVPTPSLTLVTRPAHVHIPSLQDLHPKVRLNNQAVGNVINLDSFEHVPIVVVSTMVAEAANGGSRDPVVTTSRIDPS